MYYTYECMTDEMTVTFSSTIPVDTSYVDTNAKVSNFFPFCTIGISMYQKRILPYIIIPTFSPQASSPLERYGRTTFFTPCSPKIFFFGRKSVIHTHRPSHFLNAAPSNFNREYLAQRCDSLFSGNFNLYYLTKRIYQSPLPRRDD